jgi:hypothetical protein
MCNFHHFEDLCWLNLDLQPWIFNFEKIYVNIQAGKGRTSFWTCDDSGASFSKTDEFYFPIQPPYVLQFHERGI